MPAFPSFDLSNLDLSNLDLALPDIKLPDIKLPGVTVPDVDTERLVGLARDAAYVGIGFGVLAVQQTQVRRRELQAGVERGLRRLAERLDTVR